MNWINYLLQTNFYLICFFILYKIAFSKETYFNLNRIYLVAFTLFSFFIPFWQSGVIQSWFITQQISETIYSSGMDELIIYTNANSQEKSFFSLSDWLLLLYALGVIYMTAHFCFNLWSAHFIQNAKAKFGIASSFFGKVTIDKSLPHQDIIMAHEQTHGKQAHSYDLLLVEIVKITCWFNPVAHFLVKELKGIHEFIADSVAAKVLGSKRDYAEILVANQFSTSKNALVHNFYEISTIKTRLIMLQKKQSRKIAIFKYGMIAPIFLGMLVLSSSFISKVDIEENIISSKELSPIESTEISIEIENQQLKPPILENISVKSTVKTKDGISLKGAEVRVVNSNRVTVTDNNGVFLVKDIDKEGELAISHIGFQSKVIKVSQLPETILLEKLVEKLENIWVVGYSTENSDRPVTEKLLNGSLNTPPQFPGGVSNLYKFIGEEIRYPAVAQRANVEGDVKVTFHIDTEGKAIEPKILRGIGFGCDEEVIRLVKILPKWTPASQNGQAVEVSYEMFVRFKLEKRTQTQNEVKITGSEVFSVVEDVPEFPGGATKMYDFIAQNMVYPKEAQRENISGSVIVKFIVTKEGNLEDIQLLKGIGFGCEDEVKRIIGEMPKWKPGKQNGIAVNTYFSMPVVFKLE